jgi:hypothetical protein
MNEVSLEVHVLVAKYRTQYTHPYIHVYRCISAVHMCLQHYRSEEQTYIPKGVLWFIFNLRIKFGQLFMKLIILITYWDILADQQQRNLNILKRLSITRTAANWVHPCLYLKADWFTFVHQVTWDASDCFSCQWLGLAVLHLACLDLAVDQSPKLKNLKVTLIHITKLR